MATSMTRIIFRPYYKDGFIRVEITFVLADGTELKDDNVYGRHTFRHRMTVPNESIETWVFRDLETNKLVFAAKFFFTDGTTRLHEHPFNDGPLTIDFGVGALN